jgi:DNA-binding MarR family transcriptional regulator
MVDLQLVLFRTLWFSFERIAMPLSKPATQPPVQGRAAPKARGAGQGPADLETQTRAWLAVVQAYHLCSELVARRMGALGVRTAEHEVLANVHREPGISQQALAARCFTAKSHVSGLVADLEQRGWLRREPDPADARAKRLTLTAEGTRIANRTMLAQQDVVHLMTEGLPLGEIRTVGASMQRVSERLRAALDAGP